MNEPAAINSELSFRVSTGLKDIIGKDLITDDYIAIFELVKNSYDADAKKVIITFEPDRIILSDNGKGMSLTDIKRKWLFVAYSAKKDDTENNNLDDEAKSLNKKDSYRDKIQSKRFYAGAKGIGRFSCDRLGSKLTLTTKKTKHSAEQIHVDWTRFEKDQYEDFEKIKIPHVTIQDQTLKFPEKSKTGTILEITDLSSKWERDRIRNLKHSLEKLINPFSETNDFNIEIVCEKYSELDKKKVDDKGKPIVDRDLINGPVKNSILDILNLKTTQIDVDFTNENIETKITDRGTLIYHIVEKNGYSKIIKNLKIHLYFLNRSAKTNFGKRMGIQPVQYGSIFLFKNGFRVQPYGNPGDDSWGLDHRSQQGYNRFLSTRDIFGRVDITTEDNILFKEVSSRDGGLVETEGFYQLMEVFKEKALKRIERYVVGVLWGEAFLRKKYFTNDNEGKRFRASLLLGDKDSEDISVIHSNLGSKIDFTQLIKGLADDKNIQIVDFNKSLVDFVNDKMIDVQPKFLKDLEKIADATNDDQLREQILITEKSYKEIQQEKEEAELRALEAEKKRKEEENKRKEAEEKAREEEEKRKQAEVDQLKAEIERLETEKKLEQTRKQLSITTSINSQDLDNVTNLHHQVRVITDVIKTELLLFSRDIEDGKKISSKDLLDFIEKMTMENNKIESISKFGTRAIFENFTDVAESDIVHFTKTYIQDVANYFSSSKTKVQFNTEIEFFITKFRPLDMSIIIDNMLSNSKKANATLFTVSLLPGAQGSLRMIFKDNGKGLKNGVSNHSDIFEKGFSTTKSTGLGLYHISELAHNYNWELHLETDTKEGLEFTLNIPL